MRFFVVNWLYGKNKELPDYLFADNPGVYLFVRRFLMIFHLMSRNLGQVDPFGVVF